jgi:hypothetical protein
MIDDSDAFAFVMPEYNHGFNAPFKNAIDYLCNEWAYKPVGFVGYGGVAAGTRAVEMAKQVMTVLRMTPAVEAVAIPFIQQFLDDAGDFHANDVLGAGCRGDARRARAATPGVSWAALHARDQQVKSTVDSRQALRELWSCMTRHHAEHTRAVIAREAGRLRQDPWPPAVGQCPAKLSARGDIELDEHLAQVPLDGARAEEELGCDLHIRISVPSQQRDLPLLSGQVIAGLDRPLAHRLASRQELATHALGERFASHIAEHLVGDTELLASIHPAALPAQPFAVQKVGSGEMHHHAGAREPLDGFAIEGFGVLTLAEERA